MYFFMYKKINNLFEVYIYTYIFFNICKENIYYCYKHVGSFALVNYKQLFGCTKPKAFPSTLVQDDLATCFKWVRWTFSKTIPLHGFFALQSNLIATGVAVVPRMFRYTMLVIFTPDTCNYAKKKNHNNIKDMTDAFDACSWKVTNDLIYCTWPGQLMLCGQ